MVLIKSDPLNTSASFSTAIYIDAAGDANENGSVIGTPTTIENALTLIRNNSSGLVNPVSSALFATFDLILIPGTYQFSAPIDLVELFERGIRLRIYGNSGTAANTVFERTGGDTRALIRAFGSELQLSSMLLRNPNGTGLELKENSRLISNNLDFGAIAGDCISVEDASIFRITSTSRLHGANPNVDAFIRCSEHSSVISSATVDAQGQAWDFSDAFLVADGGYISGIMPSTNTASITGARWRQDNGGKIVINGETQSGINIPGVFTSIDNNQDADALKLSIEKININANLVFSSRDLAQEYSVAPTNNRTIQFTFTPLTGWRTRFYTRSPQWTIEFLNAASETIAILGGAAGYDWVEITYDGGGYETLNGPRSQKRLVANNETITIHYDAGAGDDRNSGVFSVRAIASIQRLNQVLNGYYLGNVEPTAGGAVPQINIETPAHTSTGGLLDLSALGTGKIVFNSTGTVFGINSCLFVFSPSNGVELDINQVTFLAFGMDFFGNVSENNRDLVVTTSASKGSVYYNFNVSNGGDFPAQIIATALKDLNLSPGVKCFIMGARVNLDECIYNEAGTAIAASPILIGGGAVVRMLGGTIGFTHPIAFVTGHSFLEISSTFAKRIIFSTTYDYRYLVNADEGSTVEFSSGVTPQNFGITNNAKAQHLVRMTGLGFFKATSRWTTRTLSTSVDTLFQAGGLVKSDNGLINQAVMYIPQRHDTNKTIDIQGYGGYHFRFFGTGVTGTIRFSDQTNSRHLHGTDCLVSALDSATLVIDNKDAFTDIYVDDVLLAANATLTSVAGITRIQVEYIDVSTITVTVLKGSFV